jgi:hypothetical protein
MAAGPASPPGAPGPPGPAGSPLAGSPDEREAGLRRVACERCGAAVLVAKFSPRHTSVQWSPAAVLACAEFSARMAAGEQTALIDGCASLRDSIDGAVRAGRLRPRPPFPA